MIKINFDGIQEFHKDIEKWVEDVPNKADKLCEELCDLGREEADTNFRMALYSGVNDVRVRTEEAEHEHKVVAEGKTVLFIEYGTGVHTEEHSIPQYQRGGYGDHKGANPKGWVYVGQAGNNAFPIDTEGRNYTLGDPANECMYKASEEMRDNATRIAKEVFKK